MAKLEISDTFVDEPLCMNAIIDAGIKINLIDYDPLRGIQIFEATGDLIPKEFEKCMLEVKRDGEKLSISNVYEVNE